MAKNPRKPIRASSFKHTKIEQKALDALKAAGRNARTHSAKQIKQIAASIETFGFVNPVLVDSDYRIVAGHGRVEAARNLGMDIIPVIRLEHLSAAELKAYAIADNRLAELAGWDKEILALELADLITIDADFDVSVTGFDHAEIDLAIQQHAEGEATSESLPDLPSTGDVVSTPGMIWVLGEHRILCGDVRSRRRLARLMDGDTAQMVFTDPPYNVPIDGHVSGLGRKRHSEFEVASGEMTPEEFAAFLYDALSNLALNSTDGALHYVCMDWRHLRELMSAGGRIYTELKNICVWNKTNGGMGSFYRSKHELVLVYKHGRAKHTNNIELGRFGRYRSNVWDYAGVNTWRKGRDQDLSDHPTVKPILLVADAIQDASNRGDVILDGFGGAGTTLLAAERVGRRARLVELDPRYVDVSIARWEKVTGRPAIDALTGSTFSDLREGKTRRFARKDEAAGR